VGRNLHEHPGLPFCTYVSAAARATSGWRRQTMLSLRYSSGVPDTPQGDMYIGASIRAAWHGIGARLGLLFFWINKPYSAGRMRLASPDPAKHPIVEFNMLADHRDFARMENGIRFIHKVLQHPAVAAVASHGFPAAYSARVRQLSMVNARNRVLADCVGRLLDGPEKVRRAVLERLIMAAGTLDTLIADRDAMEEHIRRNTVGLWHASGTCRMGREDDPDSVVDPQGRVIGIGNLRVVDASLMPTLPTANTTIPTVMVAEKMADAILG
jgi:5-(hydroxymethyl)furfural/furfural oxidase